MKISQIKAELSRLRKEINYHNKLYYDNDSPEISDEEYDKLKRRLEDLESAYPEFITSNSPTQKVGGSAKKEIGRLVNHDVPMLSLRDVFNCEDVKKFIKDVERSVAKFGKPEFIVEEKIDGLSLALRYYNGKLTQAITRGDGINQGEDVTENAFEIKDIVKNLIDTPKYFEIRGEVYIPREKFLEINERQKSLGLKLFSNPRNCAAGTLRQLNSRLLKKRQLSMFVFNLQKSVGVEIRDHIEAYEFMKQNKIKIIQNYKICRNFEEVWEAIEEIKKRRDSLEYDIDGAVIKVNSFFHREILKATNKFPYWAIAYKYPPNEKETVLKDIILSVGRTGRITPTAIFDMIRLNRTNVVRATLHNQNFIDKLDIRIGDTIRVYKSGEIIPRVSGVVKSKRPPGTTPYKMPNNCPICIYPLEVERDSKNLRCTNPSCPSQLRNRLINFVSRSAMDIKGLGESKIDKLLNEGFLKSVADIYRLHNHRNELINKKIFGAIKNTDKILAAIEESKKKSPINLLVGLGVHGVGTTTAHAALQKFDNLEGLSKASYEDIYNNVPNINKIGAKQIRNFFDNPSNQKILKELKELNLNFCLEDIIKEDVTKIVGKIFVLRGKFADEKIDNLRKRDEITKLIESKGGIVKKIVDKNTDYIVNGMNSNLDKIGRLKLKFLSEKDLRILLDKN